MPSARSIDEDPVVQTRRWVETLVVGLDLCPFARPVLATTQYRPCDVKDPDAAVRFFLEELDRFQCATEQDAPTTLLVFTRAFSDFEDFLDGLAAMQTLLEQAGLDGEVQLASFHPQYRFDGSDDNDPANFTNRAPYPTVHLLREAMVSRAVDAHPDPEGIAARNEARLRGMGTSAIEALLKKS